MRLPRCRNLGRLRPCDIAGKSRRFGDFDRLLFRSGPASGAAVRSHERAGAGAAREPAGAGPAQALHRPAALRGAVRADRAGAQLAGYPATGNDEPFGGAAAGRAHGHRNPTAVEITAAAPATTASALLREVRRGSSDSGLARRAGLAESTARGASREPDSDFSSLPMLPPALPDCATAPPPVATATSSGRRPIPIKCLAGYLIMRCSTMSRPWREAVLLLRRRP